MDKEDIQTIKDVASLQESFRFIKDALKKQDKTLERIESQVLKTNGRVNNLEEWKKNVATAETEMKLYRRWLIGIMLGVVPLVGGMVWGITKYVLNHEISDRIEEKLPEAVASVLENYEFNVYK